MALRDYRLDNLPRSMQILLFAGVALGLIAVFYFFYMRDRLREQDGLRAEVSELEQSVAQGSAIAGQLDRFKQEVAQLERRLNVLRAILPSEKETPQILRNIQRMAAGSGLKITRFMPQPVVPRPFYSDWPILLEVRGYYDALGSFLEKIGQSKRIINVENIALKGIEGSADPTRTLNAACTAVTFVFREDLVSIPGK
jgi:type IV pilus assembly protein PilO